MLVSVVVRSKDEADRLRLTLLSLARQTAQAEVVVVNDGSSDRTRAVLDEAADSLALKSVHHATAAGRSGASNAGARTATGEILVFLDGDTIANPDLVARHAAVHAASRRLIGRGETFHLRETRFFQDPETATPWPGGESRLAGLGAEKLARMRVTRDDVQSGIDGLDRRAAPGIYPGAASRRLHEIEMDALHRHPDCGVLWAAASGHNLSVEREEFMRAGGFDEALDLNEHRELALRLYEGGCRMVAVDGARTYHQTHRRGLRDPLVDSNWEDVFYRAHPILAVKLLSVFWASLGPKTPIPPDARIASLPELEVAARGQNGIDYDAVRKLIPSLRVLAPAAGTSV